jgi:tetratricopeptide (TPR) repeat protein
LVTAQEIDVEASQQKIEARAHYALSNIAISRQNFAEAKTEVERSLALFEALGDAQRRAGAYYNLGVILAREGQDLAAAQTYFQKCLVYWQETGNLTAQTYTLLQLAMLERDQGEFTLALSYLDQAEVICLKINDAAGQATVRLQRGLTYLAGQEPDRACPEWQLGQQSAPEHLRQNFLRLLDQHCVEKKPVA